MAPLKTGDLQEFKGLLAVDEPPVLPVWGARWRVFPCARERDKLGLQSHGSKRKRLLGKRTERAPADKFKVCKQVAQVRQSGCNWPAMQVLTCLTYLPGPFQRQGWVLGPEKLGNIARAEYPYL